MGWLSGKIKPCKWNIEVIQEFLFLKENNKFSYS
jgi:hypothetical protein